GAGSWVGGEQNLVGLELGMVVWQYVPAKFQRLESVALLAGRYWYAVPPPNGSKGKPQLIGVQVPDAKVREALAKLNVSTELAVKPGSSVSLEVQLPDEIKETVSETLKAVLAKNE